MLPGFLDMSIALLLLIEYPSSPLFVAIRHHACSPVNADRPTMMQRDRVEGQPRIAQGQSQCQGREVKRKAISDSDNHPLTKYSELTEDKLADLQAGLPQAGVANLSYGRRCHVDGRSVVNRSLTDILEKTLY